MLDLQEAYQRQAGDLPSDDWINRSTDIHSRPLAFTRGLGSLASYINPLDSDFPQPDWPDAAETEEEPPVLNTSIPGSFTRPEGTP